MARRGDKTQRTSQAILAAAIEVFAARGIADATIDEIAAAGGVSVGSVYFHFGNKSQLYSRAVETSFEQAVMEVEAAAKGVDDSLAGTRRAHAYLRFATEQRPNFELIAHQLFRVSARTVVDAALLGDQLARVIAGPSSHIEAPQCTAVLGAWTGYVVAARGDAEAAALAAIRDALPSDSPSTA